MFDRQSWVRGVLGIVLVLATEIPARAQIGVTENQTDGPGPFLVVQIPFDRLLCLVQGVAPSEEPSIGTTFGNATFVDIACATDGAGQPTRIRAHLSAEYALAFSSPVTDTPEDFPDLRQMSVKPLVFVRLHENLDLGIGAAAHRFAGRDFLGHDFHFWRFAVPLRARITWPWTWSESRWRALYLSLQADYFPGEFNGGDFRARPHTRGATFRQSNAVVTSWVLGVDVIKVFTGRWRWE